MKASKIVVLLLLLGTLVSGMSCRPTPVTEPSVTATMPAEGITEAAAQPTPSLPEGITEPVAPPTQTVPERPTDAPIPTSIPPTPQPTLSPAELGSVQLADSAWPMRSHDIRHSGQSAYQGSPVSNVRWKLKMGTAGPLSSGGSAPAIGADGTVYVGWGGQLLAINPDGTLRWTFETLTDAQSSPAIGADGTIYFGAEDDHLYAISPDGTLEWKFPTGDDVISSPVIGADETVYVGSTDGYLYALNHDSTLKWTFQTGGEVTSSPAIGSDGTVYFGSGDHYLYAVDQDGVMKWQLQTGGSVASSPSVGPDGTIYVGSSDRHLYAVNPDGGWEWKLPLGASPTSPAVGADGTAYVGSQNDSLYAVNRDGTVRWRFQMEDSATSAPAVGSDGTVFIGSADRHLYAVNADGTLQWKFETEGSVYPGLAIGSDGAIYANSGGSLYAFGPASGPAMGVSAEELDFGAVALGDSNAVTLTVFNFGDALLSVTEIGADSVDFSAFPASFTVPVGSSQEVKVTFTPSSLVAHLATLTLASNDVINREMTVGLRANLEYQMLYLQPESALNEVPHDETGASSWTVTENVYPPGGSIEWEYTLQGDINGSAYYVALMCGCFGLDGTDFEAEIVLRNAEGESVLAATTFTGGPAAPWPFQPQRIRREIRGIDPDARKGDVLVLRVTAVEGNVGIIAFGEPLGQSYVGIPVVPESTPGPTPTPTRTSLIRLPEPVYAAPSSAIRLAVAGDYAYVADNEGGLHIIDVTNPARPTKAGFYDMSCPWPDDVAVAGDYAYVIDCGGLIVINVADAWQPTRVGSVPCDRSPTGFLSVVAMGDYAFVVADNSGLSIIDVSDPRQPAEVGFFETPRSSSDVAVVGDYAYVVGPKGLRVINVADPTAPAEVGSCQVFGGDENPRYATRVAVAGDYAYVATRDAVCIVDIADRARPAEISFTTGGNDVAVAGGYAYIAAEPGLRIIDVADPALPLEVGSCHIPGFTTRVVVVGDYAYVAAGDGGLRIIDIVDPAAPVEAGFCDAPGP